MFSDPQPEDPYDAPTKRLAEIEMPTSEEISIGSGPPSYEFGPSASAFEPGSGDTHQHTGGRSSGRRTWLIVLVIVTFVLVVCCCLILGIIAIASADSTFQEELDSAMKSLVVL